ncbi:MAG: hypothetical protein ACRYGK_06160 [Janthinobacterium lividum]
MTRITVNDITFEIDGENISLVCNRIFSNGTDVTDTAKRIGADPIPAAALTEESSVPIGPTQEAKKEF